MWVIKNRFYIKFFLKNLELKILVGEYVGSATIISSPGRTTLKIDKKTDPNPVGC